MDTEAEYLFHDAKAREGTARFARDSNPASLHRELACARFLLQSAVDRNEIHLAATLLGVIAKTSRSAERAAIRSNDLLARQAVLSIAEQLLQAVVGELEGTEGWELKIDRISAAFLATIEKAENPPSALLGE
jgi:hypothetical protein